MKFFSIVAFFYSLATPLSAEIEKIKPISVSLGEISEASSVKIQLPELRESRRLVVEDFRASCGCVTSIGLKKGQELGGKNVEPVSVSLDVSGYRGAMKVEIAAKCKNEDGAPEYLVWMVDASVKPNSTLRKFYDLGTFDVSKKQGTMIEFSTISSETPEVVNVSESLSGRVTLNPKEDAGEMYKIEIIPGDAMPGIYSGSFTIKFGELLSRIALVWQIEGNESDAGELVLGPTVSGVWSQVKLPLTSKSGFRIVSLKGDVDESISFRIPSDDQAVMNAIDFKGNKAGAGKGNLIVEMEGIDGRHKKQMKISFFFLRDQNDVTKKSDEKK